MVDEIALGRRKARQLVLGDAEPIEIGSANNGPRLRGVLPKLALSDER